MRTKQVARKSVTHSSTWSHWQRPCVTLMFDTDIGEWVPSKRPSLWHARDKPWWKREFQGLAIDDPNLAFASFLIEAQKTGLEKGDKDFVKQWVWFSKVYKYNKMLRMASPDISIISSSSSSDDEEFIEKLFPPSDPHAAWDGKPIKQED